MRRVFLLTVAVALLMTSSPRAEGSGDVWYSVFFPGWGQVRSGRYGRGAAFLTLGFVSLTGLFLSDIQYDRAVEDYNSARASYLNATYIGDAEAAYDRMNLKWDEAENLHTYRHVFLYSYIGVWAINVVDMLIGPNGGKPPITMSVGSSGFYVTKTISF
jgi:hypothetical protein